LPAPHRFDEIAASSEGGNVTIGAIRLVGREPSPHDVTFCAFSFLHGSRHAKWIRQSYEHAEIQLRRRLLSDPNERVGAIKRIKNSGGAQSANLTIKGW
jgi:hypothetical protein